MKIAIEILVELHSTKGLDNKHWGEEDNMLLTLRSKGHVSEFETLWKRRIGELHKLVFDHCKR